MSFDHIVIGVTTPDECQHPDHDHSQHQHVREGFVPFAYSVGLDRRGWPEFLLIGSVRFGHVMINDLSLLADPPEPGPLDMGGQFPLYVVEATDPKTRTDYVVQSDAIHGVRQLVICDTHGRYPWDEGCDEPYASMPVLGEPHV